MSTEPARHDMHATPEDYASVIVDAITTPIGDYGGFAAVVGLYDKLHPRAQRTMRLGVVIAMRRLEDRPGALADLIHVATNREMYDEDIRCVVNEFRRVNDARVQREAENYAVRRAFDQFSLHVFER